MKQDLTGQRFGRLVAVRPDPAPGRPRWICQCDCGAVKSIRRDSLICGNTSSCGCARREATGKRMMGKLRAIPGEFKAGVTWELVGRSEPPIDRNGHPNWRVRCKVCGAERDLPYNYISYGTKCVCSGGYDRNTKSGYRIWHNKKRNHYVVIGKSGKHLLTTKDKAKAEAYLAQLQSEQSGD